MGYGNFQILMIYQNMILNEAKKLKTGVKTGVFTTLQMSIFLRFFQISFQKNAGFSAGFSNENFRIEKFVKMCIFHDMRSGATDNVFPMKILMKI